MNSNQFINQMDKQKIFIGIPLDEKTASLIEADLSYLDKEIWRATSKENLHITALYIGGVDANLIPYIEEIVENVAARTRPISFIGARAIVMRPDEPTMLWIKYDRSKYFESLVEDLEKYLRKIGTWESKKQKSYNKNSNLPIPHITIARVKGGGMADSLLPPIDISSKLESFTARSIALYRSNRDPITGNISYDLLKIWSV